MYQHFATDEAIQGFVKSRWDFLSTECTVVSYMLTPKFADEGFFVDNDRVDVFEQVKKFVAIRSPEHAEQAKNEMINFGSKMSDLIGSRKETVFSMNAKKYWNVFGKREFPSLYICAKSVNEMICSSAASERVWSIYRFIHSRLRNRLSNEKVEKLVYIYINCAILDKADDFDYVGVMLGEENVGTN
jgi:hypothetical protein